MINNSSSRRNYASIDIESLENSLKRKFETSNHFSDEDCCIYRVPQPIRQMNEKLFTPQVISIGPFHHGREEFKAMEELKIRYLQDFLQRTQVSMKDFLLVIKANEERLRKCYVETIKLKSNELVEMILLDAIFLIELFLRDSIGSILNVGADVLFSRSAMRDLIENDLWLMENQLPVFILDVLFKLASTEMSTDLYEGLSMAILTRCFFKYRTSSKLLIESNLLEKNFHEAAHFVDLVRLCLQPPKLGYQKELRTLSTPSAEKLHMAGVKFKLGSHKHLFDIKFKDGVLEIPKFTATDSTESLLVNLQMFERFHNCRTNYINDYIVIMHYFVNSPKDVELLTQDGVIDNWLSDDQALASLFHRLDQGVIVYVNNYYYSRIVEDLNSYCKSRRHKWKANLKQNYFNTPWASISVVAAAVLLILTLIQTVFTIIK